MLIDKEVIRDRIKELEEAHQKKNWFKVYAAIENLKSCIDLAELFELVEVFDKLTKGEVSIDG